MKGKYKLEKINGKMRNKNKKIIISTMVAALIIIVSVVFWAILTNKREELELKIDGEEVSAEEYIQTMKDKEYKITVYFKEQYDAKTGGDFWEVSFGDETPYKKLADDTLEELKYRHAIFAVAEAKGYLEDASYPALKQQMEEENQKRQEKIDRGEPVYGLSEYTLDLYLEYEMSSLKEQYCNDENNEDMKVTEDELEQLYNSREWLIGEDGKKAELEEIRSVLEKNIREERYEKMIEERAKDSLVDTNRNQIYEFTLKNINN